MCGIWGVFSKEKNGLFMRDADVMTQMMTLSYLRGKHSTGLSMVDYRNPHQRPGIWKVLGGPQNMFEAEGWGAVETRVYQTAGVLFGHSRHATRGDKTIKNAHPFNKEHITLVHNGTLHSGVSYEKDGEETVEVDSHALTIAAAKIGIGEALKNANGAYAIIAHDAKEGAMYIARNDQRTLYLYENATRMFVMSEKLGLEYIMNRENITGKTYHFEAEKLYRFDLKEGDLEVVDSLKKLYVWQGYPPPRNYQSPSVNASDNNDAFWERQRTLAALQQQRQQSLQQQQKPTHSNYPSSSNVSSIPSAGGKVVGTKTRIETPPDPLKIWFEVMEIEAARNSDNWIYGCLTTTDDPPKYVQFISNKRDQDLIGKKGNCFVDKTFYENEIFAKYIIKMREIEWENGTTEIITFNKRKLRKKQWDKIIKDGCTECLGKIEDSEASETYVSDNAAVCKACVRTGALFVITNDESHRTLQ